MEFVHKAVIEGGKILKAVRTILLKTLEKKHLGAWIQLLKQSAELSHGVTACRNAQHIMNQSLDKLLLHIFTGE